MNLAVEPFGQEGFRAFRSDALDNFRFEPPELTRAEWVLFLLSIGLLVITSPVSFWFCIKTVRPYDLALHCRFGRVVDVLEPGLTLYNPLTDYLVLFEPKTLNVQTDKIILSFGGQFYLIGETFVEYRMINPGLAFAKLPESEDYVGKMALVDTEKLLRSKDALTIVQNQRALEETVKTSIQTVLDHLGYKVNRVYLHIVAAIHPDAIESSGPNMMYH